MQLRLMAVQYNWRICQICSRFKKGPFIIDVCCSDEKSLGVKVQRAADVEAVLLKHGAVKQAGAIGVAGNRLVEVVAVFIELKTGKSVTEEEIMHYCRQHLASFKVPRRVVFVSDWPMTGAGKIQRLF